MPLKKQYLKSKPEVKVTFEIEKEATQDAEQIFLLAEFNEWQPLELSKLKNGKFKVVVNVPTDQQASYQFKYKLCLADGVEAYDNDWEADAYQANGVDGDNSVLQLAQ
ncbi:MULTISPECIES: isoamylase early set domain-containing protein [unclassified Agarivorans]|uniref:isoamylase early set domain-containing protein n=1 Tax=unclassified Agarivorans TaxID=2636026 RepID=UPI0010D9F2BD|nr:MULTISPECIES: isoamylase early set domain-containing protein [unclassified Agarivorans]MDO6685097.1 isoamylase early set domain-containing protein [Agarivorans sp. 3_MG-2023]MDO6715731.1 isoamylase early set domain-containing protein [Agarivorans sp. 2_MG-2023]MDO6763882.1 isoamylase early set domain-containing protein [Agarivorans sp. 1_MG-2023]GDY27777.1 1,4-alpha-glucan-branching protein [Agarivorans sp. Toyoura001]